MDSQQRKWIGALYQEMFEKLMVLARLGMENESLAEEAVQETFRIACQKPEAICGSPNPRGWLVNTLRNTMRNLKSSHANASRIMETYMTAQLKESAVCEDRIDLNVLYVNVADTEEFRLLKEMAVEGRSHAEMARARGIEVSTCRKRVQRAKEMLRRKIKI